MNAVSAMLMLELFSKAKARKRGERLPVPITPDEAREWVWRIVEFDARCIAKEGARP